MSKAVYLVSHISISELGTGYFGVSCDVLSEINNKKIITEEELEKYIKKFEECECGECAGWFYDAKKRAFVNQKLNKDYFISAYQELRLIKTSITQEDAILKITDFLLQNKSKRFNVIYKHNNPHGIGYIFEFENFFPLKITKYTSIEHGIYRFKARLKVENEEEIKNMLKNIFLKFEKYYWKYNVHHYAGFIAVPDAETFLKSEVCREGWIIKANDKEIFLKVLFVNYYGEDGIEVEIIAE